MIATSHKKSVWLQVRCKQCRRRRHYHTCKWSNITKRTSFWSDLFFLMIQNILDHSLSSTMPVWFFANILKMVKLRDQDCELFSCFWFFYNPVQYITKIARDSCQRSKLNSFLKIWKAREVKNACCCKMSGTRFCFKLARRCHTATKIVWWPKDQCCHQGFKKWQNYC